MLKKILLNLSFVVASIAIQAQALLPTSWNFSNPSIASPPTGWTLSLGTGSLTYAFGIGDALSCRLDATGEFVLIQIADKPGPLSYYLSPQNAGAAWGGQFDIQESDNGTSWTNLRSITYKATTTTNFTGGKYTETNLKATTRFIRFFYTSKLPGGNPSVPGGNMALDSVLILSPPPPTTPVLQVLFNNNIVANNSQTVIGKTTTTLNYAYKIKNVGTLDTLVIDSINFNGASASNYSVSNSFPLKIASKDSIFINCSFTPTGLGSKISNINIYNNDSDKTKFTLSQYGIGGDFATEPLFSPVDLTVSNLTAWGMSVNLADTVASTENYIVLRKKSTSIAEIPSDGISYQKGDYIGTAQVAYIGKKGTFVPTYILANNDYTYKAFAFNGPAGFQNYLTSSSKSVTTKSLTGNAGNYYTGINPNASNFLTALSAKVNPHDTIFYSSYISTVINNFLTRDTTLGKKVVNCVYTNLPYIYNEPFVWNASGSSGILTREHTRAQSTMPSNVASQNPNWPRSPSNLELPEYNDLHNLFPAHQTLANAPRSNNPFGECVTVTSVSPSGFGKLGKDAFNNTVYEPKDEQKGDLARALFYMSVCYNGIAGNNWKLPTDQDLVVLMKWHQQDPPSDEEIARHEYIASIQKNRNPFIDNPTWANLINFKTMVLYPAKSVTVVSPNGGENIAQSDTFKITWTSTSLTSKVKLEYTANGTDYIFIDSVAATPPNYSWITPATIANNYKIRISSTDNAVSDTSNASFSIKEPFLELISPNGNENLTAKDTLNITWNSLGVKNKVKIEYTTNGTDYILIDSVNASVKNYKWTIPSINSNSVKVRISSGVLSNMSDSNFSITTPTLTIQNPNGGNNFIANEILNINWLSANITGKVKLEYTTNGTNYNLIDTVDVNLTNYNWTIPSINSNTVKIRITSSNGKWSDGSDSSFSIATPFIKIESPNGGESLIANQITNIKWVASNVIGKVKLEYTTNGVNFNLIDSVDANVQNFNWTIPALNSNSVKIRIGNNFFNDLSDSNLSIVTPFLTIQSPNGGEVLIAKKTTQINWLASNISGKVKLEYSINGADYVFIDSVNANTLTYSWTLPSIQSNLYKVKISNNNNAYSDISDANFTVNVPSLKLLTPVLGTVWISGEIKNITWQSSFVDSINIQLRKLDSVMWSKNVIASLGITQINVPSILNNSENVKVHISEIGGSLIDSSSTFVINKTNSLKELTGLQINIYPNPSNGVVNFTVNRVNSSADRYELFDIAGKQLAVGNLELENVIQISEKGIFVLKILVGEKTLTRKIIVH